MSKALLVRYLKMVVEEAKNARVPNQLVDPSTSEEDRNDAATDVNEFSGVGAIAGYTAPLGASPDAMGRQKNAPKKRRRNKK